MCPSVSECMSECSNSYPGIRRSQGEVQRLQTRLQTAQDEQDRLQSEGRSHTCCSGKTREEHRRAQDELEKLQELYDRSAVQFMRMKDSEERSRDELERLNMELERVRGKSTTNLSWRTSGCPTNASSSRRTWISWCSTSSAPRAQYQKLQAGAGPKQ